MIENVQKVEDRGQNLEQMIETAGESVLNVTL